MQTADANRCCHDAGKAAFFPALIPGGSARETWGVLLAAMAMQLCLGGIYAWSAFVPALRSNFGYTAAQTQFVFGSALVILCLGALVTGRIQDRSGGARTVRMPLDGDG